MNNNKIYKGNLNVGQKIVKIVTDINYQCIEIEYIGTINITSTLPQSYIVKNGNNKIIITKLIKDENILSDLFSYKGRAMITKCILLTDDLKQHNIYINKLALELYNTLDGTYDFIDTNWNHLTFDGNNNKKSYIYRKSTLDEENNTFTTIKEIRKK
jgi:hypothetical protein|tara:strand:- start:1414 stop:1884 length:471 start_codon:yes stop_codon:yes gene_type:complete